MIFQTVTIVDGLCRQPFPKVPNQKLHGQNALAFLIVANIAIWIWETIEPKVHAGTFQPQAEFYGQTDWIFIMNLSTKPMLIFFWFHSAIALADIWMSAYNPVAYSPTDLTPQASRYLDMFPH